VKPKPNSKTACRVVILPYWYRYQYYRQYFWSIGMTIGDTFHP